MSVPEERDGGARMEAAMKTWGECWMLRLHEWRVRISLANECKMLTSLALPHLLEPQTELENKIRLVDPKRDALYNYDPEAQKAAAAARPWARDANYFKQVRISAVALVKMAMHARSGGELEVMGLMQGYTDGDSFVVTDAFRLPVEGTETRVNAQGEANEYLVEYLDLCRAQGREENVVGWYHSHPGYGCWLSGIDVETEALQQQYQDPFLAVVIDPDRTINAGKVEIGAFRTYPAAYKPEPATAAAATATTPVATHALSSDRTAAVPLAKAAEFGAHANRYYSLDVSYFKSTLDSRLLELLWNKYWVQTLSQSPLLTSRDYGSRQMVDLSSRMREAAALLARSRTSPNVLMAAGLTSATTTHTHTHTHTNTAAATAAATNITASPASSTLPQPPPPPPPPAGAASATGGVGSRALDKLAEDCNLIAAKEQSGLMAGELKAKLFNHLGASSRRPRGDASEG